MRKKIIEKIDPLAWLNSTLQCIEEKKVIDQEQLDRIENKLDSYQRLDDEAKKNAML